MFIVLACETFSAFFISIAASWGTMILVVPFLSTEKIFLSSNEMFFKAILCTINLFIAYLISILGRKKEEDDRKRI